MKQSILFLFLASTLLAQRPSFEVATIKPNDPVKNPGGGSGWSNSKSGLKAFGSLHALIKQAYGVEDAQISGGTNWLARDMFEINAKPSAPATADELRLMLQTLLAERFKLTLHRETRQLPVYDLVVAKGGAKLVRPNDRIGSSSIGATFVRGQMDTTEMARHLTSTLGRNVIDKTELKGAWKFNLTWAPEDQATGPSLFTAIQEQLGLKLESTKGPVEVLVIDHAEPPSEN